VAQPGSTPSERPADARPRGVTLLAILAAISGLLAILGSIALMPRFVGAGAVELVLAVVTLGFGLLYVVLAYGLWTLKPWAWTLGVGLSAGSIVLTIVNLTQGMQYPVGAIISVAISAAVIYYLFTPGPRRAFGKA
jgi:lysylphosphatidylglycerol synthetase-like protein (DUF2156 family)